MSSPRTAIRACFLRVVPMTPHQPQSSQSQPRHAGLSTKQTFFGLELSQLRSGSSRTVLLAPGFKSHRMRPPEFSHPIPRNFHYNLSIFPQITLIHLQHRTIMNPITATSLMATLAVASIIPALSAGLTTGETWSCTQYAQANTQSASKILTQTL